MTNYIVTDSQMISLADAIREKGGTSASLTFPNGMISAISDISTGGDEFDFSGYYAGTLSEYSGTGYEFNYRIGYGTANDFATTQRAFTMAGQSSMTRFEATKVSAVYRYGFYNCRRLSFVSLPECTYIGESSSIFNYVASSLNTSIPLTLYLPKCSYFVCSYGMFLGFGTTRDIILTLNECCRVNGNSTGNTSATFYSTKYYNSNAMTISINGSEGRLILKGGTGNQVDDGDPNKNTIIAYGGFSNINVSTFSGQNKYYLNYYAFYNCQSLSMISMENCFSTSNNAIYSCSRLRSIYMPNVEYLGIGSLPALESLVCPKVIKASFYDLGYISNFSYSLLETLLVQGSNINSIDCPNLTSLSIYGKSLAPISELSLSKLNYALINNCPNLVNISLPALTSLAQNNISNCYSLEKVYTPLLSMPIVFSSCYNLRDVGEYNFSFIGTPRIFQSCSAFRIFNQPSITNITGYLMADEGCISLSKCIFSNLQTLYQNTGIQYGSHEYTVFGYIPNLKYLDLGYISNYAQPGYNTPVAPSYWFKNNHPLVIVLRSTKTVLFSFLSSYFTDSTTNGFYTSVYVQDSLVNTYKSLTNWSVFSDRIMPLSSLPITFMIGSGFRQAFPTSITWSDWLSTEFASAYGYYEQNGSIFTSDGTQYISGINTSDLIVEDQEYELVNV